MPNPPHIVKLRIIGLIDELETLHDEVTADNAAAIDKAIDRFHDALEALDNE